MNDGIAYYNKKKQAILKNECYKGFCYYCGYTQ